MQYIPFLVRCALVVCLHVIPLKISSFTPTLYLSSFAMLDQNFSDNYPFTNSVNSLARKSLYQIAWHENFASHRSKVAVCSAPLFFFAIFLKSLIKIFGKPITLQFKTHMTKAFLFFVSSSPCQQNHVFYEAFSSNNAYLFSNFTQDNSIYSSTPKCLYAISQLKPWSLLTNILCNILQLHSCLFVTILIFFINSDLCTPVKALFAVVEVPAYEA